MRGRWKELELGTWKAGDMAEPGWELTLSYFRYVQNKIELIEIDCINMIRRINGVDQMASVRQDLGIASVLTT